MTILCIASRITACNPPIQALTARAAAPASHRPFLEQGPGMAPIKSCCAVLAAQDNRRPRICKAAVADRGAAVRGSAEGEWVGSKEGVVQGAA